MLALLISASLLFKQVDDVYSKMTLEERVAQICGIWGGKLADKNGKFDPARARALIPHGIGHVCQFACTRRSMPDETRDFVKDVQNFIAKETRTAVPAVFHDEVITGIASRGATVYPQQIGVAASFDVDLMRVKCRETAEAGRMLGASFALSPMADVIYNSVWTRLEEGYGESGYLAAAMGVAFVEGLQQSAGRGGPIAGLGACAKHFLGYGTIGGGSSRDWKDIYEEVVLPHEAMIRRADASAVMTCYDEFRGEQAVSSDFLLNDVLRGYIGFKGVVVSDYGAVNWNMKKGGGKAEREALFKKRAKDAIMAGNDIELPQGLCYPRLIKMVKSGEIPESVLEKAVKRALTLKARLGLLSPGAKLYAEGPIDLDPPQWRATSRRLAEESVVLLKNNGVLPLSPSSRIALVGPNANSDWAMLGDYTYQQMQAFWQQNPQIYDKPHIVTLKEALKSDVYARGVDWNKSGEAKVAGGGDARARDLQLARAGNLDETDFDKAVEAASRCDVIVAAMGENYMLSGEARQRATDKLPKRQDLFVKALLATGKPVVLVFFGGRNLVIDDETADKCAAILHAYYPGEEGGNAVAAILRGEVSPSGRLPMTYPRVYDRKDITFGDKSDTPERTRWPFGHGLTYTSFRYEQADDAYVKGDWAEVPFALSNTGSRDGTEVVQVYLDLGRTRLRAFGRVALRPGEKKNLVARIPLESFAEWDGEKTGKWALKTGKRTVRIGSSAWNTPVRAEIEIKESKSFPVRDVFFGFIE